MKKFLHTIVMICDKPNTNGRIYPTEMMKKVIEENKKYFGHFNGDGDTLSEMTNTVENLTFEDNILYGDLTILDTPKGNIAQDMMDNIDLGLVIKGEGETDEKNVVSNFTLQSINIAPLEHCGWKVTRLKNMENKINIELSEKEIGKINEIKEEIIQKRKELLDYIKQLRNDYDINKSELCILTYKKPVEIDKDKRKFLEPHKYELKDFIRLAYYSWEPYSTNDGFRIHFYSVSGKNNRGNEIQLYGLQDISYEILSDYTIDEAKKLLKEIKNEKNN